MSTIPYVMETKRTHMREYRFEDAWAVGQIFCDPRAMRYAPMAATSDASVARAFIAEQRGSYSKYGFGAWMVVGKDDGRFFGQAGLLSQESGTEVFYSILPEYWRRGFGTEVALACRDYAFQILNMPRLISIIHPENAAAIKVALNLGMSRLRLVNIWGRGDELFEVKRPRYAEESLG